MKVGKFNLFLKFIFLAEQGKFLALDLGGTNFRVLCIDLHGDQFNMMNEIYEIPQEIMLGSGEQVNQSELVIFILNIIC